MAFFCCSSATGSKVIAIISLIFSIILLLVFGTLSIYDAVRMEKVNSTEEMSYFMRGLYGKDQFEHKNTTIEINGVKYYTKEFVDYLDKTISYFGFNFSMYAIFVAVYSLIASIELLQGVRQKDIARCNIWLRWYLGSFLTSVAYCLLVVVFVTQNYITKGIQVAIGWPISVYFMYVVYSFTKEVKAEEGGKYDREY